MAAAHCHAKNPHPNAIACTATSATSAASPAPAARRPGDVSRAEPISGAAMLLTSPSLAARSAAGDRAGNGDEPNSSAGDSPPPRRRRARPARCGRSPGRSASRSASRYAGRRRCNNLSRAAKPRAGPQPESICRTIFLTSPPQSARPIPRRRPRQASPPKSALPIPRRGSSAPQSNCRLPRRPSAPKSALSPPRRRRSRRALHVALRISAPKYGCPATARGLSWAQLPQGLRLLARRPAKCRLPSASRTTSARMASSAPRTSRPDAGAPRPPQRDLPARLALSPPNTRHWQGRTSSASGAGIGSGRTDPLPPAPAVPRVARP